MKRNMGMLDRTIRTIVGLAIIGAGVYYKSWWGALGALPIVTSATGFCPAYLPFKMSTVPKREAKS
jgi:hypothetical protein